MTIIVKMDQKCVWPYTVNLRYRPWVVVYKPIFDSPYSIDSLAEMSRILWHARAYGGEVDERGYCFPTFEHARAAVAEWVK
jgi:hypothetical protein